MKSKSKSNGSAADRLRRCYQYERKLYAELCKLPADYRVPAVWRPKAGTHAEARGSSVWDKVARLCKSYDVNPTSYIQWCLSMDALCLAPPPEPNQLLEMRRLVAYFDYKPKRARALPDKLMREVRIVQLHYSSWQSYLKAPAKAWIWALLSQSHTVSPLVQYALATMRRRKLQSRGKGANTCERLLRIAVSLEADALVQFQRDADIHRSSWIMEYLPQGFADKAEQLYDLVLDKEQ